MERRRRGVSVARSRVIGGEGRMSAPPPPATQAPRVYLNCPRCGLTIAPKADWLAIEHCPRCVARYHTLVSLFASTLPKAERLDVRVR